MKLVVLSLAVAAALGATAVPAAAEDYRGHYWFDKYFGRAEAHPYRNERSALPRGELQVRAFDQGFYNAHHLHHAANGPEVYALAREAEFDNEVVIMMDDRTGEVIAAAVLPH